MVRGEEVYLTDKQKEYYDKLPDDDSRVEFIRLLKDSNRPLNSAVVDLSSERESQTSALTEVSSTLGENKGCLFYKKVFRKFKFVTQEMEVFQSPFCKAVFDWKNEVEDAERWVKLKKVGMSAVSEARTQLQNRVKDYFILEETLYLGDKKKYDTGDETTVGRVRPERPKRRYLSEYVDSMRNNNEEVFRLALKIYLPLLCGKKLWEREKALADKTVSKILSISDEAMLLMVLENCWDHWQLVAKHKFNKTDVPHLKESMVQTKYTHFNDKNNGRWVLTKALPRFNELQAIVVRDRDTERGRQLENDILDEWRNEKSNKKRKRRDVSEEDLEPLKVIYYDDEGNVVSV